MGRPPKKNAKWLKRELNDVDRRILLLAGNGSIIRGYHEVLSFYAYFYLKGFRYWMPRECLQVSISSDENFIQLGKKFKKDKSYKSKQWFTEQETVEDCPESPESA